MLDTYAYDSYLDGEFHPLDCPDCEENMQLVRDGADWLRLIVKQLYSREKLDFSLLENSLDELCAILKVEIGEGRLQIDRKIDGSLIQFHSFSEMEAYHDAV